MIDESAAAKRYLSRDDVENFLIEQGAAPEDISELVSGSEFFTLRTEGAEGEKFSIAQVPDYLSDSVYSALSDSIGESLIRYYNMLDWLGEDTSSWVLRLDRGEFIAGERGRLSVQLLGSVSEISNTWLWAWARPPKGILETSLRLAEELREHGERTDQLELMVEKFSTNRIGGMDLALLCSSLCPGTVAFDSPYQNGCAYLLFDDVPPPILERAPDDPRLHTIVKHILNAGDLDRFYALGRLFKSQGFEANEETEHVVTYTHSEGSVARVELIDRQGIDFKFDMARFHDRGAQKKSEQGGKYLN